MPGGGRGEAERLARGGEAEERPRRPRPTPRNGSRRRKPRPFCLLSDAWGARPPPSSWRRPILTGRVSKTPQRARGQQTPCLPSAPLCGRLRGVGGLGEPRGVAAHSGCGLCAPRPPACAAGRSTTRFRKRREARSHRQTPGDPGDAGGATPVSGGGAPLVPTAFRNGASRFPCSPRPPCGARDTHTPFTAYFLCRR